MKQAILVVGLILVLVIGGVAAYDYLNRDSVTTPSISQVPARDESMNGSQAVSADSERYVAYTPEAFEAAADTRRVLFFYANWCPTCRPVDRDLSENTAQLPEDVTVIRVNYDDNETDQAEQALAGQYQVTYQHTFVQIDAEGTVVTQWNGGGLDQVLSNIQ